MQKKKDQLFLRVKDFETYQHYKTTDGKNRKQVFSPTWIKLYTKLLDDPDFLDLPQSAKATMIMLWLFASRSKNNLIPYKTSRLCVIVGSKRSIKSDLELLISEGYFTIVSLGQSLGQRREEREERKKREEVLPPASEEDRTSNGFTRIDRESLSPALQPFYDKHVKNPNVERGLPPREALKE